MPHVTDSGVTDKSAETQKNFIERRANDHEAAQDIDFLKQFDDEIRSEDFVSEDEVSELLSVCEEQCKEVSLSGENNIKIIQEKVTTKSTPSWKDIPLDIYWENILDNMGSCCTYKDLENLVQSLIAEGIPLLEPRANVIYIPGKHICDVVVNCKIPVSGPYDVTVVKTNADGNCLP